MIPVTSTRHSKGRSLYMHVQEHVCVLRFPMRNKFCESTIDCNLKCSFLPQQTEPTAGGERTHRLKVRRSKSFAKLAECVHTVYSACYTHNMP